MNYQETFIQTTNYSEGVEIHPTALVLHHMRYPLKDVINMFTNSEGVLSNGVEFNFRVSAHIYIEKNGNRTKFGEYNQKLWHAGKSSFKGKNNCNNFTIGVEFEGDTNKEPLTEDQIYSFTECLIEIIDIYPIKFEDVTTHMRIAPSRKVDISETEFKKIQEYIQYLWV